MWLVGSDRWLLFPVSPIFIMTFFMLLVATIAYPELPPGVAFSWAIGIDPTVEWGGFPMIAMASAIFNGVVYGTIAWLILFLGLVFTYKGD